MPDNPERNTQHEVWKPHKGAIRPEGYPTIQPTYIQIQFADQSFVDTMTGELIDSEAMANQSGTYVRLTDHGVDMTRTTIPLEQTSYEDEYASYKQRVLGPENSPYNIYINQLADKVTQKLHATGQLPTAFVTIPSRKELHTSHAVEALESDFKSTNPEESLFFIVLHNDTTTPAPQTLSDLEKVHARSDALVLDAQFDTTHTVGDARAILADVVIEVCYRMRKNVPVIIADSDIERIAVMGSVHALLQPLLTRSDVAAVASSNRASFDSIKANKTFALRYEIEQLFDRAFVKSDFYTIPTTIMGAFAAFNPIALMKIGGIPRVRMGEDHIIRYKIAKHVGRASIVGCSQDDSLIEVNGAREVHAMLNNTSRYQDWQQLSDQARMVVTDMPLNVRWIMDFLEGKVIDITNAHFPKEQETEIYTAITEICERYGLRVRYTRGDYRFRQRRSSA